MAEYFREFAFVASLLAGFSFAFFGTLLGAPKDHRVIGPAAGLALAASTCFLIVTLGNTFAAATVDAPSAFPAVAKARILQGIGQHLGPISMLFLVGILLLLTSFGAAGWSRSRRLGYATTIIASLGALGAIWALLPFLTVQ